jgi:hypothetical protein
VPSAFWRCCLRSPPCAVASVMESVSPCDTRTMARPEWRRSRSFFYWLGRVKEACVGQARAAKSSTAGKRLPPKTKPKNTDLQQRAHASGDVLAALAVAAARARRSVVRVGLPSGAVAVVRLQLERGAEKALPQLRGHLFFDFLFFLCKGRVFLRTVLCEVRDVSCA